ncbi:MAG: TraB/GumN family protein [Gammaproteobacteria bacterium]
MHKLKLLRIHHMHFPAALAALLFCLFISLAQASTDKSRGLLWELSKPGIPASYLFGTLHSEDPDVVQLAAPVQKVFDAAQAVVIEVLFDMEAMRLSSTAMLMMDGRSLKDIVGESLFAEAAAAMQVRGMPEMLTMHMQPWAVAVSLSTPVPETGQVLDMVLYQQALQLGKPVYGLETIQEQLGVFTTMPLGDQVMLLRNAVEHFHEIDALYAELLTAWKQRDLARLVEINEAELADGGEQFAADFQKRLVVHRNRLMAERMQPYLKQGGAFIAVGALHLPGVTGLLTLLEQGGYTVSLVY